MSARPLSITPRKGNVPLQITICEIGIERADGAQNGRPFSRSLISAAIMALNSSVSKPGAGPNQQNGIIMLYRF